MAVDGKVVYKVDYDTKDAKTSLKTLGTTIDNVGEKAGKVGDFMSTRVTAPAVALGGVAVAGFTKLSSELDNIAKSAAGVGAGVEELQAWQFAGRKAGIESAKMVDTMRKVQQMASQNSDAFWELGIQTQDSAGNMLQTDEIMSQLVRVMEDMGTAERNNTLLALGFTRELEEMNKIMDDSSGFAENLEKGLDNAISDKAISDFEKFNDTIEDLKIQMLPIGVEIAEEMMPHLQDFADWLANDGIDAVSEYTGELIDMVAEHWEFIAAIVALGPALKILSGAIAVVSSTAGAVFTGIAAAGATATAVAKAADDYVDEHLGFESSTPQMFYNIGAQMAEEKRLAEMYMDPGLKAAGYGQVNIGMIEVNAETNLEDPSTIQRITDSIMHEVGNELTGTAVFSQ